MKKTLLMSLTLFMAIILVACGKPSDKLEGDWISTNPETGKVFGKEFSFKNHTFQSNDDGVFIKYYKFIDDNEKILISMMKNLEKTTLMKIHHQKKVY